MSTQPNLFIIGSMKSGTTSLHNYLDAHPDIYMSDNKEPGYFVEQMTLSNGVNWYLSLFEGGERYRYVGESSTHYTKLPTYTGVAERIHAYNPSARLIYIMRDPFERLLSHYWHEVRKVEHGGEHRTLCNAVQANPEYLAFSHYAMQLRPYIELFGKEAVYTLTFESLKKDTNREVNKIFTWLGLPPHDITDIANEAHNQKPAAIIGVAGLGLLNRLRHSRTWGYVSELVPKSIKQIGNRLAEQQIDENKIDQEIPILKSKVAHLQQQQTHELELLLGRKFPEWLSTRDA